MREQIFVKVEPRYIHFIGAIMEGYEHLGIVSTVRGEKNVVLIRVTPDTYEDVAAIVKNLPFPAEIV